MAEIAAGSGYTYILRQSSENILMLLDLLTTETFQSFKAFFFTNDCEF